MCLRVRSLDKITNDWGKLKQSTILVVDWTRGCSFLHSKRVNRLYVCKHTIGNYWEEIFALTDSMILHMPNSPSIINYRCACYSFTITKLVPSLNYSKLLLGRLSHALTASTTSSRFSLILVSTLLSRLTEGCSQSIRFVALTKLCFRKSSSLLFNQNKAHYVFPWAPLLSPQNIQSPKH